MTAVLTEVDSDLACKVRKLLDENKKEGQSKGAKATNKLLAERKLAK